MNTDTGLGADLQFSQSGVTQRTTRTGFEDEMKGYDLSGMTKTTLATPSLKSLRKI